MKEQTPRADFMNGLVFGFDVGTASIGWAVRRGTSFLDVGVLICPDETSDMSGRRGLRRQRRTLRSRKYRRQWFARELETLGLPKPTVPNHDPVNLRLKALQGDALKPEELHAALVHLFRRRGYTEVPWKQLEEGEGDKDTKKEVGEIKERMSHLTEEMQQHGCEFPCQLLAKRQADGLRQRKEVWPRDLLEKEFRATAAAQEKLYPKLLEKAAWLLYGGTQEVKDHHVFFNNTAGRDPGVLGLRWPRFENRGPAVDSLRPVDEQGRPLHVVRKDKQAFTAAQWELAVMNFRVIERATGAMVAPNSKAMARLREMWESSRRKKKNPTQSAAEPRSVEIKVALLEKWAREFDAQYKLVEGQQPLTPQTGAGRARYSSPTLEMIRTQLANGLRVDPPQPVLQRAGESTESALNRYLAEIKHPVVRHRLVLFRRQLAKLVSRFGQPDLIVLEAVRSLALSPAKKRELVQRNKENRDERAHIRGELADNQQSTSRNSILRYRLWKEARCVCPFCCNTITKEDLYSGAADIEHLVPRALVDCNEFYNLTVGHIRCNREFKGDATPFTAFGQTEKWPQLRDNAEKCFKGRKLEIFLSPQAEELIEQKADLQHTAYIARVIRHLALLQLGWIGKDGRDPTPEKQNSALRFQVSNGQLTSRLRQAWGLNHILHPLPPGTLFHELPPDQQKQFQEKNRGDHRHHALDAIVIACTLPWLAHRTHGATDELGNHGWWTQDEKQRSKAANPLFPKEGALRRVAEEWIKKPIVRHHVSKSTHKAGYETTIYGQAKRTVWENGSKKRVAIPDTYLARKELAKMGTGNFRDVFPVELGAYLSAAWERFEAETPDLPALLKQTKDKLPSGFIGKLCFSHFQSWREAVRGDAATIFTWPAEIKIPIQSVKLVAPANDATVVAFAPGTNGFVKRNTFREVRIYPAADGKGFVPVFVPYWRADKLIGIEDAATGSRPVAVLRKQEVLQTVKPLSTGHPPGHYCLYELGQVQAYLLPPHVAKKEEAIISFGIKKSGIKPRWPDLIRALGYELPHSPSPQPQPPGAAETGPVAH